MSRIQSDASRFRKIVRGKVREELKRHLGHHELFGREGKNVDQDPEQERAEEDPRKVQEIQSGDDASTIGCRGSLLQKRVQRHAVEAGREVAPLQLFGAALVIGAIVAAKWQAERRSRTA